MAEVYAHPIYQKVSTKVSNWYSTCVAYVSNMDIFKPVKDAHIVLSDHIQRSTYKLRKLTEVIIKNYLATMKVITDFVSGYVESVIDQQHIDYVHIAMQETYLKVNLSSIVPILTPQS